MTRRTTQGRPPALSRGMQFWTCAAMHLMRRAVSPTWDRLAAVWLLRAPDKWQGTHVGGTLRRVVSLKPLAIAARLHECAAESLPADCGVGCSVLLSWCPQG